MQEFYVLSFHLLNNTKNVMKKFYFLLLGAMLATNVSAQMGLGESPKVTTPEGYRLDSTYTESWHPRYHQGKHEPDQREEFRYDSQGRKTLYLQFSYTRYMQDEYGVWESFLLEEPDLWKQVRYHYTDKGELDREICRSYDFYEHEWMDDFTIYSDFDEETGLPRYFWNTGGKYEEGDEAKPYYSYFDIVKYHDKIPETVYLYQQNPETGEWEKIASYLRQFNEWGGIESEDYEFELYRHRRYSVYQYDEHHNLTEARDTTFYESDGETYTTTWKFFNEYDEDGLLKSMLERPASSDGFFIQTFYYWSKVDDPSGITALSSDKVSPTGWYDLSGRRLTGQPSHPGLYIKDGKKVAVK